MNSQWLMIKGDEIDGWFDRWHAFINNCLTYAVNREIAEAGHMCYDEAFKLFVAWSAETLQSILQFHLCVPVGPS